MVDIFSPSTSENTFHFLVVPNHSEGLEVTAESGPRPNVRQELEDLGISRTTYREALENEIKFAQPEDPSSASGVREYVQKMTGKVAIVDIEHEGNKIHLQTTNVPFFLYKGFASPETPRELLPKLAATGTAAVLITSDNYMLLQDRSSLNALYSGVPGASIAGMLDAQKQLISENSRYIKGVGVVPLTNQIVKDNLLNNEMPEELGITKECVDECIITALAQDNTKPHLEFCLLVTSNRPLSYFIETSTQNAACGSSKHSIIETIVAVPFSIENIEKLVGELQLPLPPTHCAAFIAAGSNHLLRSEGVEKADEWLSKITKKAFDNYARIDRLIMENPLIPQQKYDPKFPGAQYDFPTFMQALSDVGLGVQRFNNAA
jgi:hypothetical protein